MISNVVFRDSKAAGDMYRVDHVTDERLLVVKHYLHCMSNRVEVEVAHEAELFTILVTNTKVNLPQSNFYD